MRVSATVTTATSFDDAGVSGAPFDRLRVTLGSADSSMTTTDAPRAIASCDEGVAVGAFAAQRDEQRARLHRARIPRDRVDRRRERAGDASAR